jgi:alkanesulfonate monooxygenase SsuD/methylene tetrahydromethanopterin reductase-like flavin-dependent oxidoreductase (luciferase family)
MRFLLEPAEARTLDDVVRAGEAAHREGLDGVLLTANEALPAPLVTAAALAARVPDIRIAVEAPLGDRHPLELAEEAAIVDVQSGGRLILVVRPAGGRDAAYAEALDLLRLCFAAAPFRFDGEHWRVPANLEQNVHNPERRVRMLPSPAQPRLALWTAGAGRAAGAARGLCHLADADEPWQEDDSPASLGAPRARRDRWDGPEALLARLRAGRERFGQDWAAVAAGLDAVPDLGAIVRPRVQIDRLPDGLEAFWDEHRPWLLARD